LIQVIMSVFGTNDRRYGTLAQLETYDGLACAPTAVTNALLALNLDGLLALPDSPGSHESLYSTRADLAEKIFLHFMGMAESRTCTWLSAFSNFNRYSRLY
jgi:hypothetical protein